MCGIAGAIRTGESDAGRRRARAREVVRSWVSRMSEAQRHRGPDGSGPVGVDRGQEVVFGHRRLAIIDLSEAGAQPMVDPDSGCAVTFNGEIYNFAEIRRELEAAGERFRSASDTEVILKAYQRWGIDAVRRFRGIFALALWDPAAPRRPPGARPDGHQAALLDGPARRRRRGGPCCSRPRCARSSPAASCRGASTRRRSRRTSGTASWSARTPSSRASSCCPPPPS